MDSSFDCGIGQPGSNFNGVYYIHLRDNPSLLTATTDKQQYQLGSIALGGNHTRRRETLNSKHESLFTPIKFTSYNEKESYDHRC